MTQYGSVFGKIGEVALHSPIPAHARDGMLPPALHLLQGTGVRVIAGGDDLLEVMVLRLDDSVSGFALQPKLTRPTQLVARHRLHGHSFTCPLDETGTLELRVILSFRGQE